jgi:UDP-N-acetylmuramyl pentapeptide synthase
MLVHSTVGRHWVKLALLHRAWPLFAGLAGAYRTTALYRTHIIAITGSYGKSTTWRATRAALGLPEEPVSLWTYKSRLALGILRVAPGSDRAVFEVAIDGRGQMNQQARLLRPQSTIVTSIGHEHRLRLGTLETTRDEKANLVRVLPPSGLAVLNGDDPNVRWMAGQTRARTVSFGLEPGNDIRATDVQLDWPRGTRFTLHVDGQQRAAQVRLIGRHQVNAILAALAVARNEGVDLEQALDRLAQLEPTEGRLQPVPLPNGAWLLRDEFKGGLETAESALEVLAQIPALRRQVLIGDLSELPGSQGPIYRRLGERLAELADRVVTVGGSGSKYAVGYRRAGGDMGQFLDAGRSVHRGAALLAEDLRPGDVVLIKGRFNLRLERAAFLLMERTVRCNLTECNMFQIFRCGRCPMLEAGWDGHPTQLGTG